MIITIFRSVAAKAKTELQIENMDQLAELILSARAREKQRLPWLKMARFGEQKSAKGSLRHDRNVLECEGVELDYDGGVIPMEEAAARLNEMGLWGILYRSPSWRPDKPKWRLLLPFGRTRRPEERVRYATVADELLGGDVFSTESFVLSQSYYYGTVEGGCDGKVIILEGETAVDELPDAPQDASGAQGRVSLFEAYAASIPGHDAPLDPKRLLREMRYKDPEGTTTNNTLLKVSAHYLEKGREPEWVVKELLKAVERMCERDGLDWDMDAQRAEIQDMCDRWIEKHPRPEQPEDGERTKEEFWRLLTTEQFLWVHSDALYPKSGVDAVVPPVTKKLKASAWVEKNQSVDQMTWAPGYPRIIFDTLMQNGGFESRKNAKVFNIYRAPEARPHTGGAEMWVRHLHKVYPEDADHIEKWLAFKVQHPDVKINHALLLGGSEGIGKDTLLEPVRSAIGHWNWKETSPRTVLESAFNAFAQAVFLRINEVHDLGDNRDAKFRFHEVMKTYCAAPPATLEVNNKYGKAYAIPNVCAVIMTTNHRTGGLYLPPTDRRTYCAWSPVDRAEFAEEYWLKIWRWYYDENGFANVANYLRTLDISSFNPNAPPRLTDYFQEIISSGASPETNEISNALGPEETQWPDAITIDMLLRMANAYLGAWLEDRRNLKTIRHRLGEVGYVPLRNPNRRDGYWLVSNERKTIYVRGHLDHNRAMAAAEHIRINGDEPPPTNLVPFPTGNRPPR